MIPLSGADGFASVIIISYLKVKWAKQTKKMLTKAIYTDSPCCASETSRFFLFLLFGQCLSSFNMVWNYSYLSFLLYLSFFLPTLSVIKKKKLLPNQVLSTIIYITICESFILMLTHLFSSDQYILSILQKEIRIKSDFISNH